MILALSLAWFGVGLLALTNPRLSRRWLARPLGVGAVRLARALGAAALALAVGPLSSAVGATLALAGLLLVAMAVASVAVLVAPLRPRLYAVTVPLAALAGVAVWACT